MARRRPTCRSAFSRRSDPRWEPRCWCCRRPAWPRPAEPRSPVLLGWCVQNGLQKRIEAPERYLPVSPVVGSVAEDVEQLLARFLVELRIGWNLLEHDDETGLRARFMQRVGH